MTRSKERVFLIYTTAYRDYDLIATFLSVERGKLQAMIYGARRPRSKNSFSSQIGDFVELEYEEKSNKSMVQVLTLFPVRQNNFDGFSYPRFLFHSYLHELVWKLVHPDDPAPILYNLLLEYHQFPEKEEQGLLRFITWSIGKFLTHAGVCPNYNECLQCREATLKWQGGVEPSFRKNIYFFSSEKGGMICKRCSGKEQYYITGGKIFTPAMIKTLWLMDYHTSIRNFPLEIPTEVLVPLIKALNVFLLEQFHINPKSLSLFLSSLPSIQK